MKRAKLPCEIREQVQELERLGFRETDHFHIVKKMIYTIAYSAEVRVCGIEDEDEEDVECRGYDRLHNADWESVGIVEQEFDGYLIVDDDNKPFKIEAHYKEILPDKCVICGGKVVIRSWKDRRIEVDGLKCYDHLGTTNPDTKFNYNKIWRLNDADKKIADRDRQLR